jgi:hypothetical protein
VPPQKDTLEFPEQCLFAEVSEEARGHLFSVSLNAGETRIIAQQGIFGSDGLASFLFSEPLPAVTRAPDGLVQSRASASRLAMEGS